ncbi:hypothetical protein MMC11_003283 [Xylographa trunciseda]|nr:hypothetical protein [Xylographa trunciseda]
MVNRISSAELLEPHDLGVPIPSVESVDEDYEPPDYSTSHASLAPVPCAWPDIHEITSPEPIRRPLADREDSLIPPSTVSSLYNVNPSSIPAPEVSSISRPTINIESRLACLELGSSEPRLKELDVLQENALGQLATLRLESPKVADYQPVPVREEELPQRPYFDSRLQKAIKDAQDIISNISNELEGSALAQDPKSGLHALREQALQSRHFEMDASRIIGIVGESAAGKALADLKRKSSLINSLLDVREVARTDDNGSAVTAYVTEYRYLKPHHKAAFTIEAEFSTSEKITLEFEEFLHNYRQKFRDGINEDTFTAEYEKIIKHSDVALSTIQSIFSAHSEVSEEFLLDDSHPNAFEHILHRLQSLVSSLTWRYTINNEAIPQYSLQGQGTSYHERSKLQNSISVTKMEATSGDENSIIYTLMKPTYRLCVKTFGTSVTKR